MQPGLKTRMECLFALGEIFSQTADCLMRSEVADDRNIKLLIAAAHESHRHNPWFTPRETARSLASLGQMLKPANLKRWLSNHPGIPLPASQKKIGVIMAGNIPLVGFHDMLSVLVSGHYLLARCSSQDAYLPRAVADILGGRDPWYKERIMFADEIKEADAVIATGSDNTARYFSWHYGHLPHIIRKNRNSAAILTGQESPGELNALGEDVFAYHGLGCRNVTCLLLPAGYDTGMFAKAWKQYRYVEKTEAYMNNLRYQQAYLKTSAMPYQDHDFFLLRETPVLASPVGVIHYTFYPDQDAALEFVRSNESMLQCVLGTDSLRIIKNDMIPLGQSQRPMPWEYADGVDTLAFLQQL